MGGWVAGWGSYFTPACTMSLLQLPATPSTLTSSFHSALTERVTARGGRQREPKFWVQACQPWRVCRVLRARLPNRCISFGTVFREEKTHKNIGGLLRQPTVLFHFGTFSPVATCQSRLTCSLADHRYPVHSHRYPAMAFGRRPFAILAFFYNRAEGVERREGYGGTCYLPTFHPHPPSSFPSIPSSFPLYPLFLSVFCGLCRVIHNETGSSVLRVV